ncbi:RidA family protein [Deinococcus sp. Marseille-Q6407]|uniref:RidA family protein n=1 Tax=Deinococcus sp. Marseille-Q6407 TaxID=2969223 RepID=UPI0021BF2C88|nr:RidA family protein [Deinococcus sp. Marseille-Q6407]
MPLSVAPAGQTSPVTYHPSGGTLPFSDAVEVGHTLYLSGKIGTGADGKLVPGGVQAETRQVLANIEASLNKYGYVRANLVKCTVMLADMGDFAAMNEIYGAWMPRPYPARSAMGVSGLAAGAKVEIECIAAR